MEHKTPKLAADAISSTQEKLKESLSLSLSIRDSEESQCRIPAEDLWAIFAISETDGIYYLEVSEAVSDNDYLPNGNWEDDGVELFYPDATKGPVPTGVYKVLLKGWSYDDACNGDYDGGITATIVETLWQK